MLRKLVLVGMVGVMMACCCSLHRYYRGVHRRQWRDSGSGTNVRGKGPVVEEERTLPNFSKLDFLGEGDVTIQVGEQTGVRVEAQENLLRYLETPGGRRYFAYQHPEKVRTCIHTKPIQFYVTVDELDFIRMSGSGNIYTEAMSS